MRKRHNDVKKELQNTFSWSVSRDRTFRECPRQYFFNYYGHWGGWEKDAPERTREIYVLSKLATRHTWIGQVVHDCVAHSLRNISHGIPVLPVEEILTITRNRMRQDFRQSRDHRYRQNLKEYHGMFEHEYDVPVDDHEWREAADTVDHCLRTFYRSPHYDALRRLPPGDYMEIERLSSCRFDDVDIRLKLDCATREGHNIVIWDWKTGKREGASGLTLQMACYAFYAQQRFAVPLRHVVTRRFDLYRNRLHEGVVDQKQLDEILTYVRGSIKDMQSVLDDAAANVAKEERFRKVERPDICRRCNFLKVCQPNLDE